MLGVHLRFISSVLQFCKGEKKRKSQPKTHAGGVGAFPGRGPLDGCRASWARGAAQGVAGILARAGHQPPRPGPRGASGRHSVPSICEPYTKGPAPSPDMPSQREHTFQQPLGHTDRKTLRKESCSNTSTTALPKKACDEGHQPPQGEQWAPGLGERVHCGKRSMLSGGIELIVVSPHTSSHDCFPNAGL